MSENQNNLNPHNDDKKGQIIKIEKSEMFAGPVPRPDDIEKYEAIYPGAAKIIFDEWDSQVKHRHHIEKSVIKTDNIKSILGVVFGFLAVIVAIGGGVYTALNGLQLFGGGLSFVGLAMLATAFVTSRKGKDK
ncbi:MAG: DUF2335 domain-containing protein [Candidatus Azambacteria bacterium]|nr:DUF2335 domain-containing protein [Candidatus Azambacteria bacterium]